MAGGGPRAALATTLQFWGLLCTVMACAQDCPALGQQVIWGDFPVEAAFGQSPKFQHNKNLLSAVDEDEAVG